MGVEQVFGKDVGGEKFVEDELSNGMIIVEQNTCEEVENVAESDSECGEGIHLGKEVLEVQMQGGFSFDTDYEVAEHLGKLKDCPSDSDIQSLKEKGKCVISVKISNRVPSKPSRLNL